MATANLLDITKVSPTNTAMASLPLADPVGATNTVFLDFTDAQTAAVAPAGHGRIRYNDLTKQIEISEDTAAWTALIGSVGGSGTQNFLPKWLSSGYDLTNSGIFNSAASTPTPSAVLADHTVSGTTITITAANHGLTTRQTVTLASWTWTTAGINASFLITSTTTNTFSFTLAGQTGNPTVVGTLTTTAQVQLGAAPLIASPVTDILVISSAIANIPLTIRGINGQTANLFELQDNTGAIKACVTKDGDVRPRNVAYSWPVAVGAAGTYLYDSAGNGTLTWNAVTSLIGVTNTLTPFLTALGSGAGTSTITVNNTAIGFEALNAVSGADCTALGYQAGKVNTAANNVFIGSGAGILNTSSTGQVIIGYDAGSKCVAGGSGLTAVGYQAGAGILALNCTAIGYQALNAASGAESVGVGYRAGRLCTATNNTFIGAESGYAATTGSGLCLVGYGAGGAISVATGLTAIGHSAGASVITSNNTAVGYYALNAASGADCVAVGYQAGYVNTAANNIFIGSGAGILNTSSTGQVIIGYDAGAHAVAAANYSTFVGMQAGHAVIAADCTAVGYQALKAAAGQDSTAVGYQAGQVSTGGYNTFIGASAGNATTSAANVTLVGAYAGNIGNTGQSRLTAVGYAAGGSINLGNCTAIGYYALNAASGADCTAVGHQAGLVNTGANNIFIGSGAGILNTSSTGQVIIGYDAGAHAVAAANYSTFVGMQAGHAVISANNTAIGYQALNAASGADCVAVGYQAGILNTAAGAVFIGSGAGAAVTSGLSTIFIGYQAGVLATTCNYATVIGYQAGARIATANNTAVGYQALNAVTGADCTAVGYQTGVVNTGANNTFIGSTAGSVITTGTGNIIIGQGAGAGSQKVDAVDSIAIGRSAYTLNSNECVIQCASATSAAFKLMSAKIASLNMRSKTTEVTLDTGGVTTTVASFIPADAFVVGLIAYVTVTADGATTKVDIGVSGDLARFVDDLTTTAAQTTNSFKLAIPLNPYMNASAENLVLTTDAAPTTVGKVRVTLYYFDFTDDLVA